MRTCNAWLKWGQLSLQIYFSALEIIQPFFSAVLLVTKTNYIILI